MSGFKRSHLLATTLCAVGVSCGMAPAIAQTAPADTASDLVSNARSDVPTQQTLVADGAAQSVDPDARVDARANASEIVVTARRTEERLIDVPLSITALSGEALLERNITDLRSITFATPGLQMRDFGNGRLSTPIIRGMTQANNGGADGSVSVFTDGVYISNNNAIDLALIDLERVEVVRGPQSALYGRNAFAGAINYVTRQPGKEPFARATAKVGTFGRYTANVSVSGPVGGDTVSLGIAALYDRYGGPRKDRVNGLRIGNFEKYGVQFTGVIRPAETVRIPFAISYAESDYETNAVALIRNCGRVFTPPAGTQPNRNLIVAYAGPYDFCGRAPTADQVSIERHDEPDAAGYSSNRNRVLSMNIRPSVTLPFGAIDGIFALDRIRSYQFGNLDVTRVGSPILIQPSNTYQSITRNNGNIARDRDYSAELRFSSPQDSWIRAQLGGFYYQLKRKSEPVFGYECGPFAGSTSTSPATGFNAWCSVNGNPVVATRTFTDVKQRSAFGSLEVDPLANVKVRGETRYTSEYKQANQVIGLLGAIPFGIKENTFKFWDYRVTAQYLLSGQSNIYASVGTGTRAGGFNTGSGLLPSDIPYDPEKNTTYEVGAKLALLDRRVTVEAAAYYINWDSIQLATLPTQPTTNIGIVIRNFGVARVKGFELALSARPGRNTTLSAGLAYADSRFRGERSFDTGNAAACLAIPSCAPRVGFVNPASRTLVFTPVGTQRAVQLSGTRLFAASPWLFNASIDQRFDLSDTMRLTARADYRYESSKFGTIVDINEIAPRHLLNGRLGITTGRLDVAVFVDNILNDENPVQIGGNTLGGPNIPVATAIYGDPRTAGVTATIRFR